MKKTTLISIVTLVLSINFTYGQLNTFPSYKDIVERFFSSNLPENYKEVKFIKNQYGYVAYTPNSRNNKDTVKIWSNKLNSFLITINLLHQHNKLKFKKMISCSNYHLAKEQWQNFDGNLFYGYPGFAMDIINHYKSKDNLTIDEYYSLARAYNHFADNLLRNDRNHAVDTLKFNMPFGYNSLTKEQVNFYNKNMELAIRYFDTVAILNKDYKTVIGNIKTKSDNVRVEWFLELFKFQNEKIAKGVLKPNLYCEPLLSATRNYLRSCDSNSILITYSDNDYFPLKYLQHQEGFRKDIQVLNYSLLSENRYYFHSIENSKKHQPILSSYDRKTIESISSSMVLTKVGNSTFNASEIAQNFTSHKKHFALNQPKFFELDNIKAPFKYTLETKNIPLSISDFLLIDLINENYTRRKIYFSYSYVYSGLKLNRAIVNKGYIGELDLSLTKPKYDIEAAYKFYTQTADWSGFEKINQQNSFDFYRIRYKLTRLIYELLEDNKPDSAAVILDVSLKYLPNSQCYFDSEIRHIIGFLCQLNRKKEAIKIAEILTENIINNNVLKKDKTAFTKKNYELESMINKLEYLRVHYNVDLSSSIKRLKKFYVKLK